MKYSFILITICLISNNAYADKAKGKELFDARCVSCHGSLGAGDGPVAAALPEGQKPANFQAGKFKYAVDDAKLKEVIHKGGAAVGLSPMMAAQADLSDADLSSLVEYVKSLKK